MAVKIIYFLLHVTLTSYSAGSISYDDSGLNLAPDHLAALTAPLATRFRRQTNGEDFTACGIALVRTVCSSSYAQDLINSLSRCGEFGRSELESTEYSCRQNQNGDICGELWQYISGNCSSASCTIECSNALNQAGCCAQYTSYQRELSKCGISVPSPCTKSSLIVPNIFQDKSCNTSEKYRATRFTPICNNVEAFVNGFNRVEGCQSIADAYSDTCISRNGQFCQVEFGVEGSTQNPKATPEVRSAARLCPSISNCSVQCNTSLSLVQSTIGCCIHALNATVPTLFRFSSPSRVYDTRLWEECGITVPEKCGTTSLTEKCGTTSLTEKCGTTSLTEKCGTTSLTEKGGTTSLTFNCAMGLIVIIGSVFNYISV